jgi:hypothetical protein
MIPEFSSAPANGTQLPECQAAGRFSGDGVRSPDRNSHTSGIQLQVSALPA